MDGLVAVVNWLLGCEHGHVVSERALVVPHYMGGTMYWEEEEEVMKPMEANNNSTSCKKKPTDEELEEFFSVAESEIQKSFTEK